MKAMVDNPGFDRVLSKVKLTVTFFSVRFNRFMLPVTLLPHLQSGAFAVFDCLTVTARCVLGGRFVCQSR